MRPVLIGSRALAVCLPGVRPPRDWDVVATSDVARTFGAPDRSWPHKLHYDVGGTTVEVFLADGSPFYRELVRLEQGGPIVDVPRVGPCHVASLATQFVLKATYIAYPVHFYKSLRDYHALKALVGALEGQDVALARLGYMHARKRYAATWTDAARRPESCALGHHAGRDDWSSHVARHREVARSSSIEAGWASEAPSAAVLGPDRSRYVEILAEEARVIALEARGDARLFRYGLRLLITRLLPLPWRYFAADAWPEISAAATRSSSRRVSSA